MSKVHERLLDEMDIDEWPKIDIDGVLCDLSFDHEDRKDVICLAFVRTRINNMVSDKLTY